MTDPEEQGGFPLAAFMAGGLLYPVTSLFFGYLGMASWMHEEFDYERVKYLLLGLTLFFALPSAVAAGIGIPLFSRSVLRRSGKAALIPVLVINLVFLGVIAAWGYIAADQFRF